MERDTYLELPLGFLHLLLDPLGLLFLALDLVPHVLDLLLLQPLESRQRIRKVVAAIFSVNHFT